MSSDDLAIYVHVPFCESKCHYCDFASYSGIAGLKTPYVTAVAKEALRWREPLHRGALARWRARTVYFGGGTPTLLTTAHFDQLLTALPPLGPEAEVTVEANPATVTIDYLRRLRALGVNRLSFGVQSFDDALLRRLGRLHSAAQAVDSYELARIAGFDNVSIDLIYGLPGQDLPNWRKTLCQAIQLGAEHLSLYGLTVEETTTFGRLQRKGLLVVPDEDVQADMYLLAGQLLGEAGYEHYEISNWAAPRADRPAYARHNLVYWRNEPYLGLGSAAHSSLGGRRFANTSKVRDYIAAVEDNRTPMVADEKIDRALEMAETMMLGLRLTEGVGFQRFASRFGCDLRQRYGAAIGELSGLGLIAVTDEAIALTGRGRLLGNEVFQRFLSPADQVL